MDKFDYTSALKKLEAIANKVEDPATGLEDIDKLIAESTKLIEQCRQYLRSLKD